MLDIFNCLWGSHSYKSTSHQVLLATVTKYLLFQQKKAKVLHIQILSGPVLPKRNIMQVIYVILRFLVTALQIFFLKQMKLFLKNSTNSLKCSLFYIYSSFDSDCPHSRSFRLATWILVATRGQGLLSQHRGRQRL